MQSQRRLRAASLTWPRPRPTPPPRKWRWPATRPEAAAAQVELDHANVETARAQVQQAQARLEQAQLQLSYTTILARRGTGASPAARSKRAPTCKPARRCWHWCRTTSGWWPISRRRNWSGCAPASRCSSMWMLIRDHEFKGKVDSLQAGSGARLQPAAAGKRGGQLRQGGAAGAGENYI